MRSLLVAAVALVLSGACADATDDNASSSTSGSDVPLSFSAWQREVSEICATAHAEVEALEAAAGDRPSVDQMMVAIRGTLEIGEGQLAAISEVGTPDSRSEEVGDLVTAMEAQIDLFGPIIEAGDTGNAAALQDALGSPEVAATQSHLDAVARMLDLSDCGTGSG